MDEETCEPICRGLCRYSGHHKDCFSYLFFIHLDFFPSVLNLLLTQIHCICCLFLYLSTLSVLKNIVLNDLGLGCCEMCISWSKSGFTLCQKCMYHSTPLRIPVSRYLDNFCQPGSIRSALCEDWETDANVSSSCLFALMLTEDIHISIHITFLLPSHCNSQMVVITISQHWNGFLWCTFGCNN